MADVQHVFADSESASFLHGEAKGMTGQHDFHGRKALHSTLWSRIFRLLPCMLLTVIIFLLLEIFISLREIQEKHILPSQSMLGKISKKITIFNPDESYNIDPFGPDGFNSVWSKLIPPGKGHVRIEKPGAWDLSGGYPLDENTESDAEEYTISVFHQLHCLAAIKSRISLLQDWYSGENEKEYLTFSLNEDQVAEEHINHCFDYIRQAIMCNGDTTLEKSRMIDGRVVRGVDGWGVAHECRDYDAIYMYADRHRSRNLTGID